MNKQIAQSVYAAFAVGDVPSVLATMDDKVEWIAAEGFPLAGTYIGPQAVHEGVFMRLGEIGDGSGDVVEQLVAEGDTVVALGRLHLAPQGDRQGLPGEDGARAHACWRQAHAFLAARRDSAHP